MNISPLTAAVLADIDKLAARQNRDDDAGGSFWENTGRKHRELIECHGFETFKRHLNWQYGSWPITKYSSRFTLFCLLALLRRGKLPWTVTTQIDWRNAKPAPVWPQSVHDNNSEAHRLRAYALYVGLLWQYALLHDRIGALHLAEPSLGAPMPIWLNGRLISQDLAMASLDANRMASVVPFHKVSRVLEIGAGYGRLAYIIASLHPEVEYTIADIVPALAVAKAYLPAVCHGKFRFVQPHELDMMPDRSFDLVINVSSFDEMPPSVQVKYLDRVDRLCRGHLYLSGHHRLKERVGLEKLNYPSRWVSLFSQSHDVFPLWVEKVFSIE